MFKSAAPTDVTTAGASGLVGPGEGLRPGTDAVRPPKEQKLEDIKNQCSELISELDSDEDPEAVIRKHISKLLKYNELQDIALGLVTMIADQRKLRTTDILEEMKEELQNDHSDH